MPVRPEIIAGLDMFGDLSRGDLERLASVGRLHNYQKGDTIFYEGGAPEAFMVITRGWVKVVKATPEGRDLILALFGPGDPLGAVAIYRDVPYPATARAMEAVDCFLIHHHTFFSLLDRTPSLVRALLATMTHRLSMLANRLAVLTGGRIEARFARLFLKFAEELGREEVGGIYVPLQLSRQELADLLGTTIETCIRTMSRWNKEDIVATMEDGFVIRNRALLEELAGTAG